MSDQPFFRKQNESVPEWHARLAEMDPLTLSCRQRSRRHIWLDMARQALRKWRRSGAGKPPPGPSEPSRD